MKYLIWPIVAIVIVLFVTLVLAPLKFLWHLLWHAEIISFQHATSERFDSKRLYLYDKSPKEFFLEILIYRYGKEEEEENEKQETNQ